MLETDRLVLRHLTLSDLDELAALYQDSEVRRCFPEGMLEQDRKRAGWSVGQAAWRLGVSVREYRELEAGEGWPTWETWDRICELYGWPQTFVGAGAEATPRSREASPRRKSLS